MEQLQAVWLHGVGALLRLLVALVAHLHGLAAAHGPDNLVQEVAVGPDVLQQYVLLHTEALAEQVAHGEG